MANFFYYDVNGQKQGAFTPQQLKALATQGVINPQTPLETDAGKKGLAGQIPGLFAAPIQPAAQPQPVPQSVDEPVAAERKSPFMRIIASLIFGGIVGGITWIFLSGAFAVQFTAEERERFTDQERAIIKNFCMNYGGSTNAVRSGIHTVASINNVTLASFLIARGADVNAKNEIGLTPLHCAVTVAPPSGIGVEVVELLIAAGANVNAKDGNDWTPLHKAVSGNTNIEVIKLLVSAGADVNAKDQKYGNTPLHAVMSRIDTETELEIVKFLVSAGADVNAEAEVGSSPLDSANSMANIPSRGNNKATIEYLKSVGAKSGISKKVQENMEKDPAYQMLQRLQQSR